MSLAVYALTCGWLEGELGHLMEGGEGRIRLPIPAYLIEHPNGTALFDTGMHPDCQLDPAARVGARIAGLFAFDYHRGEEISARLAALGRDPARIDLIVNSHFHFDHCGGNAQIPNATLVVQRREWDAGMAADIAAQRGFNPRDFDLGHKLRLIDGEHDVFGDGSAVCLPTHGHTPGHQSLKLRLAGGDIVLAADFLLFLPHIARAPPAAFRRRQGSDAQVARPPRPARSPGRPHLFRPRPGFLGEPTAGACCARVTVEPHLRPSPRPSPRRRGEGRVRG